MAPYTQNQRRLIIASNRLPLSVKPKNGTFEAIPSSGGLVTALKGLSFSDYLWLGWPRVDINRRDRESVDKALAKENAAASGVSFDNETWDAYQRVNKIFADRISEEAADGDLIWVHDYHLLLLPRLLPDDFWRGLPVQKQLLDGVLGSDLIGFHTDDGAEVEGNNIHYNDRTISMDKYVVGVDCRRFADTIDDPEVQARIQELETQYKDKTIIIGVDRMDYTKGLPEKLEGFRVFLDQHPEWSEKVVMIQIAIPSREDVKKYQDLEGEVSKLVGQITGKYEARHGVLVLSEFTGAAVFMKRGSLLFNPSNADGLSNALYEAVTMQKKDRKKMYEELRTFVTTNTSAKWTETFLGDLIKLQK
ncbi:hypothetical protein PENSOL_c017G03400 [Penicillium solitum]|uniref:Trehalose-6-phosphate synthase n=1 Tax=Penicillium solitum TaxID=60172 RepID=A0A1V6R4A3_9EURO|nr:uncharacterized protein PENSOL_c017G03400 [Penicillium solitum]OQD96087.1 hypothetical protein PENSOL_c017G03400 [Penicillium solitum]